MDSFKAMVLGLLVILALVSLLWVLVGCVTIERVQIGPERWPGESTSQPAEIERKIWEEFDG